MSKAAEKNGNGSSNTMATIGKWLTDRREDLAKLMPKHMTPERLTAVSLNCISKTPALNDCTVLSLYQCIRACAELGLEPGGSLGHAYLVPFRDNKSGATVCTLIIGYRGYIELARRSGQLLQVDAHVVHEGDEFELEYGLEPKLVHRPKMNAMVGAPVAAYCVARLAGGAKHVEVMTWAEIETIRKSSKAADTGPWKSHTEEMAKKTVVRRAAKYWPLSAEMRSAMDAEDEYVDGHLVTPQHRLAADSNVVNFAPPVDATSRAKDAVAAKMSAEPHDPVTGEVLPDEAAELRAAEAAQAEQSS